MPTRSSPSRLSSAAFLVVASQTLLPAPAHAEFAEPPESPYQKEEPPGREVPPGADREEMVPAWQRPPASTFHFHVGPALLLEPAGPGLFTALDVGQRAVGARLSAAWLRPESPHGLASYSAELWIDLLHRSELHPVVGAGASFLRGGALGDGHASAGAGSLRCTLEYELPIDDADARLSLSALALVPAIGSERTRPWTVAALTVGAGF
jgi:hypothetical protein